MGFRGTGRAESAGQRAQGRRVTARKHREGEWASKRALPAGVAAVWLAAPPSCQWSCAHAPLLIARKSRSLNAKDLAACAASGGPCQLGNLFRHIPLPLPSPATRPYLFSDSHFSGGSLGVRVPALPPSRAARLALVSNDFVETLAGLHSCVGMPLGEEGGAAPSRVPQAAASHAVETALKVGPTDPACRSDPAYLASTR